MAEVFADASSIILLEKAGLFDLFLSTYHVCISKTVLDEICNPDYPDAEQFKKYYSQGWFLVTQCGLKNQPPYSRLESCDNELEKLGNGEKTTIRNYFYENKGFVLVDDGPAAKYCRKYNIPFVNALLVPKLFWYAGLVKKNKYIEKTRLLETIGRYSKSVINKAKALDKKAFTRFYPDDRKK